MTPKSGPGCYKVQLFTNDLSGRVPRMTKMIESYELPDNILSYPGKEAGMSLASLEELEIERLNHFGRKLR